MPTSTQEALESQQDTARTKADQANSSLGRYLVSSAMAGAYVGVAVVLLLATTSTMIAAKSTDTRLIQGSVFGIALTLVVFAGAELFTGNVMTMIQGLLSRSVTPGEAAVVCTGSLLGNLMGSLGFAGLVAGSAVVTGGVPPGTQSVIHAALAGIVQAKEKLTGGELFLRAVLCNMLVCLAIWMASRTKSDAAKLLCLFWALLAFVASGFEHSVANMTVFSLAIFTHADGGTWAAMARNLLYTVPGNIVGGGLLVGVGYAYVGRPQLLAPRPTVDLALPDVTVSTNGGTAGNTAGRAKAVARTRRTTSAPPVVATAQAVPTASSRRTRTPSGAGR